MNGYRSHQLLHNYRIELHDSLFGSIMIPTHLFFQPEINQQDGQCDGDEHEYLPEINLTRRDQIIRAQAA